jgi:hypothetical protein
LQPTVAHAAAPRQFPVARAIDAGEARTMQALKRASLASLVTLLVFGGITWFALEGKDVAVLRTQRADGAMRETHVWIAEENGVPLVEAATPERAWLLEAQAAPSIELVHGGATTRWHAVPEPGADGHAKIRRLLRAKYGWADQWVAMLQDTSRSVLVRLEAIAE